MSKKNKKYNWEVGCNLPILDEHSQTKHYIVSEYLKRYVEVLMSNQAIEKLSLNIVDGFAGGGKYNDILTGTTVDGSPFLILNAIKEAEVKINICSRKQRTVDVEYHFVEKEQHHYDFLRSELIGSEFKDKLGNKIMMYREEFLHVASHLIGKIKTRNPRTQRAIFILDQYAYKDVPFNIVKKIFSELTNGEVILTFSYDSAQRYLSNIPASKKAFSNIDLAEHIPWERLQELKESGNWHAAIQEQLANAVFKASGAKHITLFFIHPKKGQSYWLVHLSNKFKARDVMMGIHWQFSNINPYFSHYLNNGVFALGYKATSVPGQKNLDFLDEKILNKTTESDCINSLSEEIPNIIFDVGSPVLFGQLMDTIGSFTIACEHHVKKSLQQSITSGELIVKKSDGGFRRSALQISSTDVVEYKQRAFRFFCN